MEKCLLANHHTPNEVKEELQKLFMDNDIEMESTQLKRWYTEEELIKVLKETDAVLVGESPYTRKVIESSKRLKSIAKVGVGYDSINVKAATDNGIVVTRTPIPELAKGIADEATGLMLTVLRRINFSDKKMREGIYHIKDYIHLIQDVYSLTVGIIGLGKIGTEFAKRCLGFGMKVQYYDKIRNLKVEKSGIKYKDFQELIKTSDVISIHVPLNPETKKLIGANELNTMKKNAVLINTARGAIVDELALYKALEERRIFGAGISVFTKEPLEKGHPFYKLGNNLDNLVLIPHYGVAFQTFRAMFLAAANDVIAVLRGRKPKYPLNPQVLTRARTPRKTF